MDCWSCGVGMHSNCSGSTRDEYGSKEPCDCSFDHPLSDTGRFVTDYSDPIYNE